MSTKELIQKNKDYLKIVNESVESLKQLLNWDALPQKPKVGVVLGSGLGLFCDLIRNKKTVSYNQVTHLPESAVPGHAGQWVLGEMPDGSPVLVAQGRFHSYEGHDLTVVTLPIRILARLGLSHVILTNAAGSVNINYKPGSFVLIDDHINFMFRSPLTGLFDDELGTRFIDMSQAYDVKKNDALYEIAQKERPDIRLYRGIYGAVPGPNYETPAEVRMYGNLGADVVGMSTAPETIVARQCGLKVSALSCVTNLGCGLSETLVTHEEVAQAGKENAPNFCYLVEKMVKLAYS